MFESVARRTVVVLAAGAVIAGGGAFASASDEPPGDPVELITNGGFADGLTGWEAYPDASVVDGRGCIDVPAGSDPYSAGLFQEFAIEKGETYRLTATVLSEPAVTGPVRIVVQAGEDLNYQQFLTAKKPSLTPEGEEFSYVFTADVDYDAAQLSFQQDVTNEEDYRLCIDDVSVVAGAEREPYVPETGPTVRVNQVGYLPHGPKRATVVSDADEPQRWSLRRGDDVVARGRTTPEGLDPTAGTTVHTVDFSRVKATGDGFTLAVAGEESYPFAIDADLWEPLRTDAKSMYYTNRSGIEILDELAPGYGREAGHVGVAPNAGDAAVPCQSLDDDSQALYEEPWTCEGTRDVTGGWYDAGDHGKYLVPAGISVATLLMEYERTLDEKNTIVDAGAMDDGSLSIPEAGNDVPDILDEARWELEWMLKMQVPAGEEYAGMTNHKVADVDWTGLPLLPADDPQERVLYRPSTTGTLNLAAAAAQGARLWEPYDAEFAATLLEAARTAYDAAREHPELIVPAPDPELDPNPGSGPYDDDDPSDEFYWAASQLYLTTAEDGYRQDLSRSKHHRGEVFTAGGFGWAETAALGRLSLATVPNELADRQRVRHSVLRAARRYLEDQRSQPFGQPYAPPELDYVWGSNSQILNNMIVLGYAHDIRPIPPFKRGFLEGMDYVFGRNALNLSYVTGYGTVFAKNQHSRWYSNQLDPSLPNPPDGTVAGGPNSTTLETGDPVTLELFSDGCVTQLCYVDDIGSWSTNELTVNWQAPMGWVASFAADLDGGSRQPS